MTMGPITTGQQHPEPGPSPPVPVPAFFPLPPVPVPAFFPLPPVPVPAFFPLPPNDPKSPVGSLITIGPMTTGAQQSCPDSAPLCPLFSDPPTVILTTPSRTWMSKVVAIGYSLVIWMWCNATNC